MALNLTVFSRIVVRDSNDLSHAVVLEPGDYVLVETANPSGASVPWLIVIGTTHGAASSWWQEQVRNDLVSIDDASAA